MKTEDWWRGFSEQKHDPIDWKNVGRVAWLVWNCARVINGAHPVPLPESSPQRAAPTPPVAEMPRTAEEAAKLLGITLDAGPDAIRAALRAKMADGAQPDHGGDAGIAKQLIAAKNLLIERARSNS